MILLTPKLIPNYQMHLKPIQISPAKPKEIQIKKIVSITRLARRTIYPYHRRKLAKSTGDADYKKSGEWQYDHERPVNHAEMVALMVANYGTCHNWECCKCNGILIISKA